MYRKKYYKCDCNLECPEEDIFDDVKKAIERIEEGRKDILCGLNLICCCCKICEGTNQIERGICKIEKGLDNLCDALRCIEFECDFRNNSNIRNGVCGVKEATQTLKRGLCQLQHCCLCDAIEIIQCGLQELDESLCELVKGIEDIRDEREHRKRGRCC